MKTRIKKGINKMLKQMSEAAVKIACNTASLNLCGQPKEPKMLKEYIKKSNKS